MINKAVFLILLVLPFASCDKDRFSHVVELK